MSDYIPLQDYAMIGNGSYLQVAPTGKFKAERGQIPANVPTQQKHVASSQPKRIQAKVRSPGQASIVDAGAHPEIGDALPLRPGPKK